MSKLEDYLNSSEGRARAAAASAAAYAQFGAYLEKQLAVDAVDPSAIQAQLAWFAAAGPTLKNELPADAPVLRQPALVTMNWRFEDERAVNAPLDLDLPGLRKTIDTLDPVRGDVIRMLDAFGEPIVDDGFDNPRPGGGGRGFGSFPPSFRDSAAGFASPRIRGLCENEVRNANASGMSGPDADFGYFDSILTGLFVSAAAAALGPLGPVVTGLGLLLVPRLLRAISRSIDTYKHDDVRQW